MSFKESNVCEGIRKAAKQSLFSQDMLQFCVCAGIFVFLTPELSSAFASDEHLIIVILMLFFEVGLIIYLILAIKRWSRTVIALISPEKSSAAARYAEFISFEEMCERVESQLLQPLAHLEYWGVNALADFLVYECYGEFFVIPYSAIRKIYSWWPTHNERDRQRCGVAIRDAASHLYVINCADRDERNELIERLHDVMQKVHVEADYS